MGRLIIFILFFPGILFSQSVYNDDIEDRHELQINDEPYISHTEECTVQKECLNIKLTEKCLIYHNDQWFEFTTMDSGIYYLNIRNQDCRDVRGVQAVIIDGIACQPESYEIMACISNGHQDDMYAEVFLEAEKTYLLLIDGYLHDYCYFDIDISTEAPSFAILPDENTLNDTIFTQDPIVELKWQMDTFEAGLMQDYLIFRRHESEKKSKLVWKSPNLRNTFGKPFVNYSKYDTLDENKEGEYVYKIAGLRQDSTQLLIENLVLFYEGKSSGNDPAHNYLHFTLPKTKRNTPYQISLKGGPKNISLEEKRVNYDKLFDDIKLDISKYRNMGILKYEVIIKNMESGEETKFQFSKPHKYLDKNKKPELF